MKSKYFISTAIPYVNADPHIGFALELLQADVLARYHRQKGEEVFFLTGSDENALKNVQAAEKAGLPVRSFVDERVAMFRRLTETLNISNDDFIRTTEERHIAGAHKLWQACDTAGDIYKKKYQGLYCVGCEAFVTDKDLVDGLCPEHHTKPEPVEEENYFFRLSKYQDKLLSLVDSDELKVVPVTRKNEVAEFIRHGLEDFSISRSTKRAKEWGIPVPGDPDQIMYVWFDALTNYINGLGYGTGDSRFQEWWQGNAHTAHLIGKGVLRFHAVYWPAMLMSAGLKPPKEVLVHGYVTVDGAKISKTVGNVIDPFTVVDKYGLDAVRYFLLREIPSWDDGDFSYEKLEARYNSDLANGLGNLVQRVATLIDAKLGGELIYNSKLTEGEELIALTYDDKAYQEWIAQFRLHDALADVWKKVTLSDAYIDGKKPWAVIKHDEAEFLQIMTVLTAALHHIVWLLQPFLPETAAKISDVFGMPGTAGVGEGHRFLIKKGSGLFPRLS